MKANFGRIMRHPIAFSRALSPFTLAHHPDCRPYSHHSVAVRGHKLCIGCFIGYPTTLATLFVLIFLAPFLGIQLGFQNAILLGIFVEAAIVPGKLLLSSKRISLKVGLKIVQSAGFGFIFFAPLTLQFPILFELLILFVLWSASNGIIGAMRMYDTEKTCGACKYKGNWGKCPGFRKVVRKLQETGFLTA